MKFSAFAGVAIVPLLARLVLCAAFVPAGYQKVFVDQEFSGQDAETLIDYGVIKGPVVWHEGGGAAVRLASFQDDEEAGGEIGADPEDDPQDDPPAAEVEPPSRDGATELPGAQREPGASRSVTARHVHMVTLELAGDWSPSWRVKPQHLAWVAAITELLGGTLLLLGLFSRVWGLGLAIAMGFAFYLTSWGGIDLAQPLAIADAARMNQFHQVFAQLGLLVLALGIFLTGPGPISLDRLFFGGRKSSVDPDDD